MSTPSLAIGLDGITDYSNSIPFIDLMKMSRPWTVHASPEQWGGIGLEEMEAGGHLDPNGWVTSLPEGVHSFTTMVLTNMPAEMTDVQGRYRITYEGEAANVNVWGSVANVAYGDGEIWFDYAWTEGGSVFISIDDPDPNGTGDYLRNMTLVREDQISLFESGEIFNPAFLDLVDDFRSLRFMDWMGTNGSTQTDWAGRATIDSVTWGGAGGAPLEVMIELANKTGTDPWFNIPHLADADYIANFAATVKELLDPDLVAHIEYSNEVWNWMFAQAQWAHTEGQALWPGEGTAWLQYYGMKAGEMADIVREVFGDEVDARVDLAIAPQTGWIDVAFASLEAPQSVAMGNSAPYLSFDSLAMTGYFDGALGRDEKAATVKTWIADSLAAATEMAGALGLTGTARTDWIADHRYDLAIERSVAELRDGSVTGNIQGSLKQLFQMFSAYKALADAHGLKLEMYEGGTHIVGVGQWQEDEELADFFQVLNYSDEMGQLYAELLQGWKDAGGTLFNAFVAVAGSSKYGSWGALRHMQDATARWDALTAFNLDQSAWWDLDRDPTVFDGTGFARSWEGSSGNDTVSGTSQAEVMRGAAGADRISASGGNDSLNGGDGNDTIFGSIGDDTVSGGTGTDSLDGGSGDDLLVGGDGNDRLTAGSGVDSLLGGAGADYLYGSTGTDRLLGGDGNDTLDGGADADMLDGDDGNDRLVGGTGNDTLFGSNGNDTLSGDSSDDRLDGGTGNDALAGGIGNDALSGGAGNDTLDGGAGDDALLGGAGDDVYRVTDATDRIGEAAGAGTDRVESSISLTLGVNLERLTLLGTAALAGTGNSLSNLLTGNGGANRLSGMAGNDTIIGGDGSDTLDGGTGADSLSGGAGDDGYVVDSTADRIVEGLAAGIDSVTSSVTLTLAANVERLALSGTSALSGTGNALANLLTGNTASNGLSGLDGNDTLLGAAGNDTLDGGSGNDSLDGGTGSDRMLGGLGDDRYLVDSTRDLLVEAANQGSDTAVASLSFTLGANLEHLVLTGASSLSGTGNSLANGLTGNAGGNRLTGLDGNDTLDGGLGNDSLAGGTGVDRLVGGAGNDVFLFGSVGESAGTGRDTIVDFARGDRIDLSAIDADTTRSGNQTFAWMGGADRVEKAGTLYYKNGLLWADVNGDARSDFQVTIATKIALGIGDILL